MNKRLLSLLLALVMVMILLPATAWAAEGATSVTVGGTSVVNSTYWKSNDAGGITSEGADSTNYTVKYEPGPTPTLTLKDAVITSTTASGIETNGDLTIILEGTSTIDDDIIACGVNVGGTLTILGDGALTAKACTSFKAGVLSYGLYAQVDIIIHGNATVQATGGQGNTSAGICSLNNITISNNATVTAVGQTATVQSNGLLSRDGKITISGGTVTAKSTSTTGTARAMNKTPDLNDYNSYQWRTAESDEFTTTEFTEASMQTYVEIKPYTPTTYTVTLPTGAGYTATAQGESTSPVVSGGSYSFTITISDGYHESDGFTVKANDVELIPTDGVYTINNITTNQNVTVEGVEQDTYTVTLPTGTGYTATAQGESTSPVVSGGNYSFTVTISDGYHKDDDFAVKANGTVLTPTGNVYTINNITTNQNVTVEGVDQNTPSPTTYTVTVNGCYATTSGAGSYTEDDLVTIDAGSRSNYTFTGWTMTGGTATLADASSTRTTFTMPAGDVTLTANWRYNGGGGSGGGSSSNYYSIPATAGDGGTISPSGRVRAGQSRTFIITPEEGYVIADVLVDGVSVGAVSEYTFEDVRERHTIEAVFIEAPPAEPEETTPDTGVWTNPFTDVSEDAWYYNDVRYAYEYGLIRGTAVDRFGPQIPTNRGMMVTILWRLEGAPEASGSMPFTDVAAGKYYEAAVKWATENGIVSGYSATGFGPEDGITREQLAAILCGYAAYKGRDVSARDDLSAFEDRTSDWALESVQWAVAEGLLGGKGNGMLDLRAGAGRAECAAILKRFIEKYELM